MSLKPSELADLVVAEFPDIVTAVNVMAPGEAKLRLFIRDGSHLDIWFNEKGRYSYHWERKGTGMTAYRFNNAPHHPHVETYPHHLHEDKPDSVKPSPVRGVSREDVMLVLEFVRQTLGRT